ncbi:MAG TPA: hypothetical protein VGI03_11790 [Verrucomicrobiae bacterium]|jgi:hypothetical protein
MNRNDNVGINRASGAAVGFVIVSLLFVVLIVIAKLSVHPPAIDADRNAVIAGTLMNIRSNEVASLNHPGWVDKQRGIVRLPIDMALQMSVEQWQNPAQARAELLARSQKATAPLPKVAPKPSIFE